MKRKQKREQNAFIRFDDFFFSRLKTTTMVR